MRNAVEVPDDLTLAQRQLALELRIPLHLAAGHVDKAEITLPQPQNGHVCGGPGTQVPKLGALYLPRRIPGRTQDYTRYRQSHVQKLRHDVEDIVHSVVHD